MTHDDFITAVANEAGSTKGATQRVVKAVLAQISDALANGEKIVFKGFGTFSTIKREARTLRNPSNGEPLEVAACVAAKFKPGADLKKAINAD